MNTLFCRWSIGTLAGLFALSGTAAAQTIGTGTLITNTAVGDLGQTIDAFGESFISPGGTLNSFTFYTYKGTGNVQFVVAPFAASTAGPALYTSAPIALANGTALTVSDIALPTIANGSYIAYLTTYGVTGATTSAAFYSISNSTYAAGQLFYYGSANPTGSTFAAYDADLQFAATFSPINVAGAAPEPAAWAMMIVGFGAAGYTMRRRRAVVRNAVAA